MAADRETAPYTSAGATATPSELSECLDRLARMERKDCPLATYRLQFHAGFTFEDARRLVPYLHALGVTHCYASPILKARQGSSHGYDIIDHNAINPELGGDEGFRALAAELKSHGMGLVLDIVPNHMGVGQGSNEWWQDVLENGRTSEYAGFFDIDWEPVKPELWDKVLLPVLGGYYGIELERGHVRLEYQDGRFWVTYFDKRFRLDPRSIPMLLESALAEAEAGGEWRRDLDELLAALRALPDHRTRQPDAVAERQRQVPHLRERFQQIVERTPEVRALVDRALALHHGAPGDARSFDLLHRLLEVQAYRLAHWLVSGEEINYRRFFDINDLVGLRLENPKVFAATHRLLRRLLADGSVTGLRIDHPDGLFNPRQYFTRLQMLYAASQCVGAEPVPPLAENGIEREVQELFSAHSGVAGKPLVYTLVEKILEPGEDLATDWPVDGTVGYDFANLVNGIFIQRRNERAFTRLYNRFTDTFADYYTLLFDRKELVMDTSLASELTVLGHLLDDISTTERYARDFTLNSLTDAIREVIACFPVYRTYIDERGEISERDRAYILLAVRRAKRRNENIPAAVFDFVRDVLLLEPPEPDAPPEARRKRLYFVLKFQQLTGPVMAKGLEDTVCYVYNRFLPLNEVGGSPRLFGISLEEFHHGNEKRAERWRRSLLATSTHDTKRSEDVRARLNVLSEMPDEWSTHVNRWRRLNQRKKRLLADGRSVPDANEEYLLYQTLVGAWPFRLQSDEERAAFNTRIQEYMDKAAHEAKVHLSWINPNPEYTGALREFVALLLDPGTERRPNRFLRDVEKFLPPVFYFGAINSLAQALLKMTAPGVPDLYQGAELWDLSLVDPDNRRPVDFHVRQQMLGQMRSNGDGHGGPVEMLENYQDGRVKLWVTQRTLNFRREHRALFDKGSYQPVYAAGSHSEHVCAFTRAARGEYVAVASPRFGYTLMHGRLAPPVGAAWGSAQLPFPITAPQSFMNLFTGETVNRTPGGALLCSEVFASFPLALLVAR
jgi:(1->4)-alpha-D-glucan 1-alpha-D-glucosylmutase